MPTEWQEPIDLRPRYRLCRVAFFLAAMAMSLYGMNLLCHTLARLGQSPFLMRLLLSPMWIWLVGAPWICGAFIASLLLLYRWSDPSWKARSSLLALVCGIDVVYWSLENGMVLGLPIVPAPLVADGLGLVISRALGIVELSLFASLGSEVSSLLGWPEGMAIARVAKLTAGISMTLWLIVAMNQLDWRGGFPPRFRMFRDLETYLIYVASLGSRAVSAFFVTMVCGNACALCSRKLTELEKERKESDPLRSRSEWE